MKVRKVRINGLDRPIGFAYHNVRVSWTVENTKARKQRESIIRVSMQPDMKKPVKEIRGLLHSHAEMIDIQLMPYTRYYVQVEVSGDNGECAASNVTWFETGKMGEKWKASWIGTDDKDLFHPVFVKEIALYKKPVWARLYITGVGLYEACLNHKKIGEEYLTPFFNDYRRAIQVQTYDVLPLLCEKNTISVLLGNGWYKGRIGFEGQKAFFGDRFACIAELRLRYEDGTEEVVCTDSSWEYYPSDIVMSDIYDGETIDCRVREEEQERKHAVILANMDKKILTDRYSMPLKVMETLEVKEIIQTLKGETVLDFGQNFSGYVSFYSKLPAGETIRLTYGEILQDGNFYHENYRTAKTEFTYISDGRREWVRPHFTYTGFRYVKVEAQSYVVKKQDFIGNAVYSAMEQTGYLNTGNRKVNQLISNAMWGLKSNFLDMPTDCPQRDERLGWTGDAQVFSSTASFFMDTRAFYHKFLWDMRQDQVIRGGKIASCLPNMNDAIGGASIWGDAATIIPMMLYQTYGDHAALETYYPMMKDWVDWISRGDETRENGPKYLFDFGFAFGDWLAMDGVSELSFSGSTDEGYLSSVYYYASAHSVAKAAEILGYRNDAEKYTALAERIKEAVLQEYFTSSGRLSVDTQTGYIVALYFGIYRNIEMLRQGFLRRLRFDGYRIKCGFAGAPLLCRVLADHDMNRLALHFFLQEEYPSWLHCVNLGATTIWERWNSVLDDGSMSPTGMNSLNHCAYGSVIDYAVKNLVGIKPIEAGYQKVKIQPCYDSRLLYMDYKYESAGGIYQVYWEICPNADIRLHIEVPFDCTAELVLPDYKEKIFLKSGPFDLIYHPDRDYTKLYDWDSTFEDLSKNQEAMDILREMLPLGVSCANGTNPEMRCLSLQDIYSFPWYGFNRREIQKAVEKLFELKADFTRSD